MKKIKYLCILAIMLFANLCLKAQDDADGCSDYPLFNRMPNFYINECELKDFDAYQFRVSNSTNDDATFKTVEGKYYYYNYVRSSDDEKTISALQIFRNFENAFKQINATIVAKVVETNNSYSFITAKVVKGNSETWINLTAGDNEYYLYIIEKELMNQVIQANEMLDALNKDGFIALDILFDTGKSTIKRE